MIAEKSMKIKKTLVDKHANKVLAELEKNGYESYLVGGCIRDLLLGLSPKDFDVATTAKVSQVVSLFRHAMQIGRRFPIAHVRFYNMVVEVTTLQTEKRSLWQRIFGKKSPNVLLEDAHRRDFTVNALYYNPGKDLLQDPLDGTSDIKARVIRSIGDAQKRVQEDPIRMLRAVRLAAKLKFKIDPELKEAISQHKEKLLEGSSQRLFQEFVKIVMSGRSFESWKLMSQCGLLDILVPKVRQQDAPFHTEGLKLSDERIMSGKKVSLIYALAMIFWPGFQHAVGRMPFKVRHDWSNILNKIMAPLQVPAKVKEGILQLYELQFAMQFGRADKLQHIIANHRFKASYDFLMMRAASDPTIYQSASWWYDFFHSEEWVQAHMLRDRMFREARRQKSGGRPHKKRRK